jgi:hypothetical protein
MPHCKAQYGQCVSVCVNVGWGASITGAGTDGRYETGKQSDEICLKCNPLPEKVAATTSMTIGFSLSAQK